MALRSLLFAVRSALSRTPNASFLAAEIVGAGLLDVFKDLLATVQDEDVIIEIGWSLTNITAFDVGSISKIRELKIHRQLLSLLSSGSLRQQDQLLWAIGNILSESIATRNEILDAGVLEYLKELLDNKLLPVSFAKTVAWVLSGLTRCKPYPSGHKVLSTANS